MSIPGTGQDPTLRWGFGLGGAGLPLLRRLLAAGLIDRIALPPQPGEGISAQPETTPEGQRVRLGGPQPGGAAGQ